MSDKKKHILVTGGAGYIGSVLVSLLLQNHYYVTVFDSLLHGINPLEKITNDHYRFIKGDIRKKTDIEKAMDKAEVIIHLAAIVGEPACNKNPQLTVETNRDGSLRLLECCIKKSSEKFIFVSTCSNYGVMENTNEYVVETSPLKPLSIYSETKVDFENVLLSNDFEKMVPVVLRFATVHGLSPRMRFDLTVNEFTKELALNRKLQIYGEQFWRPYCHITDIARACLGVVEANHESVYKQAFNIGSTTQNYMKKDIVNKILKYLPEKEALVEYISREGDPRNYRVSFEKIKNKLGFTTLKNINNGICEIIDFLHSNKIENPDDRIYRNI